MSTYAVIYERADDGGWWARAAEFPVYSHGSTREEAEQEVKAGIAFHLEETLRAGEELPPESDDVGTVSVELPVVAPQ